jgi:hypothetical protein
MHLVALEQHGSVAVLNDLSVLLECVDSKLQELSVIIEKYGCWGFLIITAIAGVEHLYSYLSVLIEMFGGNRVPE